MKVSSLYIAVMIASLQLLASPGTGQGLEDIKVTVELKNEKLEKLFNSIHDQTGLLFTFFPEQVDAYDGITLSKATRSVKATLDMVLGNTPLTYKQVNNNIVILSEMASAEEKSEGPVLNQVEYRTLAPITGTVTDGKTNMPMAGVNIIVKGTLKGTTTDTDGKFAIDAEDKDILVFSFIGFKSFEEQVGARAVIDVMMEEDVNALQEVVVNAGYYTTTDRTKTGNIEKITSKEIENQPVTTPLMVLQGRMPGVDITPVNGTPGGAAKIQIRGQNSLRFDGGNPLFVVDGVPIDSKPLQTGSTSLVYQGFDPLSLINPSNIESIEVLKDADATAIYGSRGANGVILITTKRGVQSSTVNADFNVYRGSGKIVNRLDVLNTSQYLEMRGEAFSNDGVAPGAFDFDVNGAWDPIRNIDWQKVLLGGTSDILDVLGNINWGNKNTNFRFGGGFHKETMVFSDSYGYQRGNVNFAMNHKSDNEKFAVNLSLNYGSNRNKLFNDLNFVNRALQLPPNAPEPYDESGNLNWQPVTIDGGISYISSWENPFSSILKTHETSSSSIVANSNFRYEIVNGLFLNTNIGFNELNGTELIKNPIGANRPEYLDSSTGKSIFGNNKRKSWIIEPNVSFDKSLQYHNISILLGSTWQESSSMYQSIEASGYTSDVFLNTQQGATQIRFVSDDNNQYRYNAFFTRIGYDFKDKYFLNLTGRRDGSSRFGPGKRFGNFGAAGIAWIFSKEEFIQTGFEFLSFGKLRASVGITGNDQIGDYKFYDIYELKDEGYQGGASLGPTSLFNPEFAWEETRKIEIGIELGLAKDRVAMEFSWYRHSSSNQLINYRLPTTTGFSSVLLNFDATIQNTGHEISLSTKNIIRQNFKWSSSLNLTIPKNKLVRFDGIEVSSYANIYKVGKPLSIQRLYTWTGVNPSTGENQILDRDENGVINDGDKAFMKPLGRVCFGGLNNTVVFKALELSFLLQLSKQDGLMTTVMPGSLANQPVRVLNRWGMDGDVKDIPKFSQLSSSYAMHSRVNQSDYSIVDASFIRLKTISLAYQIPDRYVHKVKLQTAKVYVHAQNLFTVTDFPGFDPETGISLPPLKILSLGLQFKI